MTDTLDPQLLDVLACPAEHHAPLEQVADTLRCTECGRVFPIRDGIPVLLLDEATDPGSPARGATDAGPAGSR
ncbi:Trm112 family protein [Nakamurella aerolata]|uniref:UPF0434 protein HKD39_11135 n=1 Tax=Nakamurella aerolata TaxID=1656892 RepID=A0A849AAU2_9ACTN|nr:Trm112 family protein [Nakamurella aerolata]NNG36258.1 Trm112 family protein [Nakamurella aerolata]